MPFIRKPKSTLRATVSFAQARFASVDISRILDSGDAVAAVVGAHVRVERREHPAELVLIRVASGERAELTLGQLRLPQPKEQEPSAIRRVQRHLLRADLDRAARRGRSQIAAPWSRFCTCTCSAVLSGAYLQGAAARLQPHSHAPGCGCAVAFFTAAAEGGIDGPPVVGSAGAAAASGAGWCR